MTVQLNQILNFSHFYTIAINKKMPIKTTYKLSRLASAIEEEIKFYQNSLRSLLQNYCLTDENGDYIPTEDGLGYRVQPGSEEECNKALAELHSLEITLPDITFTIEELDGLELTLQELQGIMPFITE